MQRYAARASFAPEFCVPAVLQFLTGREAGTRRPLLEGSLPSSDPREPAPAGVTVTTTGRGWLLRSASPGVTVRLNGRPVAEAIIRDGDIVGHGRSLYRVYLAAAAGPAAAAPRRTIALPGGPPPSARRTGLSTVVSGPGRWGEVVAQWHGESVLQLQGADERSPDELLARLGRRVRCHLLCDAGASASGALIANSLRLVPLSRASGQDVSLLGGLWKRGELVAILSPLEPNALFKAVQPLASLLAFPAAVRPLLLRQERAIVEGLRRADAGLLFGGPDHWELFCCPEIHPLWQRLGFPARDPADTSAYQQTECSTGLTCFRGPVSMLAPELVAATLARRDCFFLLMSCADAAALPPTVPFSLVPRVGGMPGALLGPAAGPARFQIAAALWGRGAVLGLVSGRDEEEVLRMVAALPQQLTPREEEPFPNAGHDRLGGFDAVLCDPGDGTWAVFADPRPSPVWRRYGLPAPVLGGAA